MNASTLVLGLLNGLTAGLLAVGLVLVYKSNRFLNLAHAQLGTLSALLLAKWVLDWGWNWWVAFILAIVVGVSTGLLVDRYIIGRLRRTGGSAVRLLLLSVAVSQVLLAITFVPAITPDQSRAVFYPQPFRAHVRIGGVALTGMEILTAVLIPLLVVGLAAFLRYSTLGKGIRAAANNPDAARLCGISVAKVSAVTWGVAGGLSAVSAVFQAPTQQSFNVASLGPYLLMLTLGAAAFGAFVSLPLALGGGLVLGLISQVVSAETSNSSDAKLAVFIAILMVVLLRGRSIARVFALSGELGDAQTQTRVPVELRRSLFVRYHTLWLAAAAILLAVVFPWFPYFSTEGNRFLLVLVLLYALVGVGLTMLIGWAGQVSLGHFALVGLAAHLAARWSPHWSLPAVLAVAGLIGAGVMVLIGLPALRVGGLALAVTTMGFAVIAADWLYGRSWVGSGERFATVDPSPLGQDLGTARSMIVIYYVALVLLVLGAAAAWSLRRWGPGRLVMAVRDNEPAASSLGLNPASLKLMILAVSGSYAAVAGVVWAHAWGVVSPDQFTPDLSVGIIALPVIGGLGSVGGAVAAAVMLYMAAFFIGPQVSDVFGDFGHNLGFLLFLAGVGQIGILLGYPRGIAGAVQVRWQRSLERRAGVVERSSQVPEVGEVDQPETAAGRSEAEGPLLERAPLLTAGAGRWTARLQRQHAGPDGSAPLLVTEGITVHFQGITALAQPDISVGQGEIVGLIGPNGAGKTTLMNVISGVLRADVGSVRIYGREVADLPADFRAAYGVGRTFQDARLFGGLTVIETIQVAMAYRHKVGAVSAMVASPWAQIEEARTRRTAEKIVERFGLDAWSDTLTAELSTGTRRICDLAAQVAAGPHLLLLDEPTAGVAQREAEAFGPLLRRIRDELDCSVLIVEHDMPLLMGLCDRVYAMEGGQVIAEGTPEEIRSNPAVIESYLGSHAGAVQRSGRRDALEVAAITPTSAKASRTTGTSAGSALDVTDPVRELAEPLLSTVDLDFCYGNLQVLFGISMELFQGEALALLGTNGAGKSTLLRAIVGLEAPSRGEVLFDGRNLTRTPAERIVSQGLVLVQGGRAVFTDMSVEENLQMQSLTVRGDREWLKDRRELVLQTFPRLAERLSQQAGNLSGGEQQQLALAKALLLDPKVLCIDELSLGLAPVVVGELIEIVERIHQTGVSVLVVEQSLNIAIEICDRAIFMEKGEIRFEGRTADLLERDDIARAVFLGDKT